MTKDEIKQVVEETMKGMFLAIAKGIRAKRQSIRDWDPGYSGNDEDWARARAENDAKETIRQSMDDIADVLEEAAQ